MTNDDINAIWLDDTSTLTEEQIEQGLEETERKSKGMYEMTIEIPSPLSVEQVKEIIKDHLPHDLITYKNVEDIEVKHTQSSGEAFGDIISGFIDYRLNDNKSNGLYEIAQTVIDRCTNDNVFKIITKELKTGKQIVIVNDKVK